MTFQFLLIISLDLLIFHAQTSIQLTHPQIYSQKSEPLSNSIQHYQYTLPVQVAKRNLQMVSLAPQETSKKIENANFSGLVIDKDFPSSFIVGEIFQVHGKITIPSLNNITYVTFCFVNKANILLKYVYSVTVPPGNFEFSINVDTRQVPVGEYYIGIYSGTKLFYNSQQTYALKSLLLTQQMKIPPPSISSGCSVEFSNDKLLVKWKEDNSVQVRKVTFKQNGKSLEYWLSNFASSFEVIFRDFVDFYNGTVIVSVQSAFSSSNGLADRTSDFSSPWTYSFVAGPHKFSFSSAKIAFTKDIPWIVSIGTNITVEGTSSVALKNVIYMEESSQYSIYKDKLSELDDESIAAGTKFSKVIALMKSGTYNLQISDMKGQYLMNRPIYVGEFLPLIPNYFDLTPSMEPSTIHSMLRHQLQTVDEMRQMLLRHVNEKRLSWGRGPLVMTESLNLLAQSHTNDMVANKYLSNVNRQGLNPQERAQKAGLICTVDELVVIHLDLHTAHQIMCRTPSNLDIIVRQSFTQIGLGVARNSQGYIYITQLFANRFNNSSTSTTIPPLNSYPPTPSPSVTGIISIDEFSMNGLTFGQTETLKKEVIDWIQEKYPTAKEDPILSNIVSRWLWSKSEDTIFDYTWNIAKYPANYLSGAYVMGPYSTRFTLGFKDELFFKQPHLSYVKFGIGVIQQTNAKVKVYVQYAK